MADSEQQKTPSLWSHLPGILGGLAAVLTAFTGLYLAIKDDAPRNNNQVISTPAPPTDPSHSNATSTMDVMRKVTPPAPTPTQQQIKLTGLQPLNQQKVSSLNLIQQQTVSKLSQQLTLSNSAEQLDDSSWRWRAYLYGADTTQAQIKRVVYHLHPTFSPNRVVGDASQLGHPITGIGWGVFELRADVEFKDGSTKSYKHMLEFN